MATSARFPAISLDAVARAPAAADATSVPNGSTAESTGGTSPEKRMYRGEPSTGNVAPLAGARSGAPMMSVTDSRPGPRTRSAVLLSSAHTTTTPSTAAEPEAGPNRAA